VKILHLITRLILGGAQENTVYSCLGQHAAGHQVTLAFGPIYGPEGSLLEQVKQSGVKWVVLPSMKRALDPLADWRAYRQCRRLIAELKPDVVHTHSSKAGIVGRHAAWRERVPAVVHTIHGLPFHPYQSKWKNAIYIAAERRAARRCHAIVSVADAMTRQALAAGIGRDEQYTTIYSGMETDTFTGAIGERTAVRQRLGIAEDDFVVGTVARLAELKGHDDLLDVLPGLVRREERLKLLWVGDGWWRKRLVQRIQTMGLSERIVLTGLVGPEEIPGLISAMDVLAHPSYREGLPRTVPQALLTGVPVICYDGDGAPEVCEDGVTGKLVPTGDTETLGEAMAWMAAHPAERRAMGREGQARCVKRFDRNEMVQQLEALYQRVLDS
jgi:glycosyltransferase involved in cell wall biosynthesis